MINYKINIRSIIVILAIAVFLITCISPYYPNVTRYENLLVVDGQLTNLPGPYKVKLSRSFRYDTHVAGQVTGAKVKIIDDSGIETPLSEINASEYSTVDSTFRGVPGKSYKLRIEINDKIYESGFEKMKPPIPIDKFYWEFKPSDDEGARRIQIMIDAHDPTNQNRYYGWEYDETWRFQVPIDVILKPEWKTCFKDQPSYFIILGTSIQKNSDIIEKQKITAINESTNRLYMRYTILAKQYSYTAQTYKYISELKKQNMNQGSLYDVVPYSLTSNVRCLTNKNELVIGYFIVAGATEKRIFIDRSELPKEYNPTDGFSDCYRGFASVDASLKDWRLDPVVDSLMKNGYQIYDSIRAPICANKPPPGVQCKTIPGILLFLSRSMCFNCTVTGYNEIPHFWTEKNN